MDESNKLTVLRRDIVKGNNSVPVDTPFHFKDNEGDGGEPPMPKYVTHEELEHEVEKINSKIDLSTEKILHHIDNLHAQTDLKINDVKHLSKSANAKANWILGILASVIAGILVAAITNLLIK